MTETLGLLRRAEAHARDCLAMPGPDTGSSPVTCPVFAFDGQIVRTISAVMRFDTAIEVTTSRLPMELMFPADDDAEAWFRDREPQGRLGPGFGARAAALAACL